MLGLPARSTKRRAAGEGVNSEQAGNFRTDRKQSSGSLQRRDFHYRDWAAVSFHLKFVLLILADR